MQSVREALLALDWKQIKKHAKIIYNVDSLGVDEKLYSCVKANAVVACLSDVKQYKYKIALQKAFDPQTEKRQMLRVTVHDAAAIATLLSSLMPKETLGYISQLLQYLAK